MRVCASACLCFKCRFRICEGLEVRNPVVESSGPTTVGGWGVSGDKVPQKLVILCKLYYSYVLWKKAKQYSVNLALYSAILCCNGRHKQDSTKCSKLQGSATVLVTSSIACSTKRRHLSYSGEFWGFSPHKGNMLHRWRWNLALHAKFHTSQCNNKGIGPQILKMLLKFYQILEYKRPTVAYPSHNFHEICRVCTLFQDVLAVFAQWLRSYGGFKLRGWVRMKFQCPLVVKLCILELQECGRRPLSPCKVWLGSDLTRCQDSKKVEFFLSVCLLVRHSFEHQTLCARFCHEGVGVQKWFWYHWIGEAL